MRPSLALRTSFEDRRTPEPRSPASPPTTTSLLTPEDGDGEQFMFRTEEYAGGADNVFMNAKPREPFGKMHARQGVTYLPPLVECSDQDSIYSQDSGCVVYTSQLHPVPGPNPSTTPKSTLTFVAIWDPDHGISTFSGNLLVGEGRSSKHLPLNDEEEDFDHSNWMQYAGSGHPDCEPHLTSRFSTTTTSTSNYIEVDFSEEDKIYYADYSIAKGNDPQEECELVPGDPRWVPQIFTLGYTKPPSPPPPPPPEDGGRGRDKDGSRRPEISEPFQLAPMKRPVLPRHNTFSPTSRSSPTKLSSSFLFTRSRIHSSPSSVGVSASANMNSSPTSSPRHGLGSRARHGVHSSEYPNPTRSEDNLEPSMTTDSSSSSSSSTLVSDSPTLKRRPSKVASVLGRLKSQKKGRVDSWVLVDVEVISRIHQRVVDENL
jgi:hypothetical protein